MEPTNETTGAVIDALVASGMTRAAAEAMLGDRSRYEERVQRETLSRVRTAFKDLAASDAFGDLEADAEQLLGATFTETEVNLGSGACASCYEQITLRVEVTVNTDTGEVTAERRASFSGLRSTVEAEG